MRIFVSVLGQECNDDTMRRCKSRINDELGSNGRNDRNDVNDQCRYVQSLSTLLYGHFFNLFSTFKIKIISLQMLQNVSLKKYVNDNITNKLIKVNNYK